MTAVLALSSQVAYGRVGLSAITPTLHALGRGAIALPTVLLSNHPGFPAVAGAPTPPGQLRDMLDALDANGWLGGVDTVLTGYLPSPAHVSEAAAAIDRVRTRGAGGVRVVVDPVMGDDPKGLYIAPDAAEAICAELAPRADILTPNFFELRRLAGAADAAPAADLRSVAAMAADLRARLNACEVIVTSAPCGPGRLGNVSASRAGACAAVVQARAKAPNGTGDVFSALIAAGADMARAVGQLDALVTATRDAAVAAPDGALAIVEAAAIWREAPASVVRAVA